MELMKIKRKNETLVQLMEGIDSDFSDDDFDGFIDEKKMMSVF